MYVYSTICIVHVFRIHRLLSHFYNAINLRLFFSLPAQESNDSVYNNGIVNDKVSVNQQIVNVYIL